MSYKTDDLSMASVSMAKVVNLEEVISDAEKALENNRLSESNHRLITDTLTKIKDTEVYEITPEMAEEIDAVINDVATVTVDDGNNADLIVVTGTEDFGYTLTPKMWKASRIQGCESLLEEINRNIKRWANQLNSKLHEIWVSNRYSLDSLKERLVSLDKRMIELEGRTAIEDVVAIPSPINKTLLVKNAPITNNPNLITLLKSEVNFFLTTVKMWDLETVDFKNRVIRFFGNKAKGPLTQLNRPHSRFFSKKSFVDEMDMKLVYWCPERCFIGGGGVHFCENTNIVEGLSEKALSLDKVGYNIVQVADIKITPSPLRDIEITPLTYAQLDAIYEQIVKLINVIEEFNKKDNDFDLSEKDVKDVLASVKATEDPVIIDAYAAISTHYQLDATASQTGFIQYAHNLCSHLITFMFINLEGYDE